MQQLMREKLVLCYDQITFLIHTFFKNIVYKNIQAQIGHKNKSILRISSASVVAIIFCFFAFFIKIFLINSTLLILKKCKSMSKLCLLIFISYLLKLRLEYIARELYFSDLFKKNKRKKETSFHYLEKGFSTRIC